MVAKAKVVKLMAVGDVMLRTRDRDPFGKVRSVLRCKDILFGNLETVLADGAEKAQKAYISSTPPNLAKELRKAGFDVINVANNHIMDLGVEGLNKTLEVLNENSLLFIGVRNRIFTEPWAIVERNGVKIGFLGYSKSGFGDSRKDIFKKIDEAEIVADIRNLRLQCDAVIVSLHWGIEKAFYPSPKQVALAHKLIDSGATIILGHHPHVIQGIERYRSGLIAYSLGNFQFEFDPEECSGRRNKRTNQSFILSVELSKDGVENYSIIPIMIDEDFVPYIPVEKKQEEIRHFLSEISKPLERGVLTERWWFEQIAWEYLSGNMKSFIVRIKRYGFMHFLQCIRWLLSPFCLRCYAAIIRRGIKRILGRT